MSKTKRKNNLTLIHASILGLVMVVAFGSTYLLTKKNTQGKIISEKCDAGLTHVKLQDSHAEPDVVTIQVHGYVQVNSCDGKTHDIASGSGDEHPDGEHVHTYGIESGNFKADEAWKVQFNHAGTFDFHDHYHPEIHFTVIVYTPNGDYKLKS